MRVVVSLFDESGNAVRDWAEAGYECFCYDLLNDNSSEYVGRGVIHRVEADLLNEDLVNFIPDLRPQFISGFPPCTDLAASGSRHFSIKYSKDPLFQEKAVNLCRVVEKIAIRCGCPWYLENPVSVLSSMWRKSDYRFHPWEYGGYLPEDDVHPRFPEYILPRDAYPKKTCIWAGGGFIMPPKMPVQVLPGYSLQHKMLGGSSIRTKMIRSETARGFAKAVFIHNGSK